MELNIQNIHYKVLLLMSDGTVLDLTPILTSLSWDDQQNELAQKASFKFADLETDWGYITEAIQLCSQIFIFADDGSGQGEREAFRGTVWDWSYDSGNRRELQITSYDKMIYLSKSQDYFYYKEGCSTRSILEDVCSRWNVALSYSWDSITHEKIAKTDTLSNQIINTLEDAKDKLDGPGYAIGMYEDVLKIRPIGSNQNVYSLEAGQNVIDMSDKISLNNLVTKVIVLGKSNKEDRSSIEATVTGATEYGTLQQVITSGGDGKLDEAKKKADKLIKDKGKPKQQISVTAPDVPFLRCGDKVRLFAGTVNDFFYVKGVTHNAMERTMSIQLERMEDA